MSLAITPLHALHRELGARMVDFGGWEMPLNYGSQIEEHHAVRRAAGMFDVSHMTVVDLQGVAVRALLRHLLANSVDKLKLPGKALYSCMLNPQGGVIDDLITYFLDEQHFRMVVNAATRDQDLAWLQAQAADFEVEVTERKDLAMIAVQGPRARERVIALLPAADRNRIEAVSRFMAVDSDSLFIARTGYTGEDGFEIVLPAERAEPFWRQLLNAGVRPAGLGARDTLRLEAGMNLYGQDMDENSTPLEAGLAWTVAFDEGRDFIGRSALEKQRSSGVPRQMLGLVLDQKGVLRHGQKIHAACGEGEILSGSFAPTLGKSIAFARLPAGDPGEVSVQIRGHFFPVRVVNYPFVRAGKSAVGV